MHPGGPSSTITLPRPREPARAGTFATRREELRSPDLNTVLSTREWRAERLLYGRFVAPAGPHGRSRRDRRCPAAAPVRALSRAQVGAAGAAAQPGDHRSRVVHGRPRCTASGRTRNEGSWTGCASMGWRTEKSRSTTMRRERRARPASNGGAIGSRSRVRWQFADRLERVVTVQQGEA